MSHLNAILGLLTAKDLVIKGIKCSAGVDLVEVKAVQSFQDIQHSADGLSCVSKVL